MVEKQIWKEEPTTRYPLPGVAAGTANLNLWETESSWPKQLLPKSWFGIQKVDYWLRSQPSVTHYQNTGAGVFCSSFFQTPTNSPIFSAGRKNQRVGGCDKLSVPNQHRQFCQFLFLVLQGFEKFAITTG